MMADVRPPAALLLGSLLAACATAPPTAMPPADAGASRDSGPEVADATPDTVSEGGIVGSVHVALGLPKDSDGSDDVILDHGYFVLSYNPRLRDANWVSWRLAASDLGPAQRQDDFHEDQLLPEIYPRVLPTHYRGSGFDRGHLCPSADRTSTPAANRATFVMTNMHPQLHVLNAGPWEQLETFARRLVTESGKDLFVMAGGVFDAAPATVGPGIAVPRASYKILVVVDAGQGRSDITDATLVYAAVMPNQPSVAGSAWQSYLRTVDEIEAETGYDFLSEVPPALQAVLESRRVTQ